MNHVIILLYFSGLTFRFFSHTSIKQYDILYFSSIHFGFPYYICLVCMELLICLNKKNNPYFWYGLLLFDTDCLIKNHGIDFLRRLLSASAISLFVSTESPNCPSAGYSTRAISRVVPSLNTAPKSTTVLLRNFGTILMFLDAILFTFLSNFIVSIF